MVVRFFFREHVIRQQVEVIQVGRQTPRQYEAEFNPVIDRTTSSRQALDAGPWDRALRGRTSSAGQFRRTAALPEQA
jgi:hypothetical protein